MARNSTLAPSHRVQYCHTAVNDLCAIYIYTAEQWSEIEAEDYTEFLETQIQHLADNPLLAPLVLDMSGVRCFVTCWNNTRMAHRIFFEETEGGITILRIQHTTINWDN